MPTDYTDTKVNLIVNKMTKAEYTAATKQPNELYACTDTNELFLGTIALGRWIEAYTKTEADAKLAAKIQKVSSAPASYTEGVLYVIPEA